MDIVGRSGGLPEAGTLVVFTQADGTPSLAAAAVEEQSGGLLARAKALSPNKPKHGQIQHLPLPAGTGLDHLFIVTLGKEDGPVELAVEQLGASVAQRLQAAKVGTAVVALPDGLEHGLEGVALAAALARGAWLRRWSYRELSGPPEDDEPQDLPGRLELVGGAVGPELDAALAVAKAQADAVIHARRLVTQPANILYPESFAASCRELAATGLEINVLDEAALAELGMRALLAVGQGSAHKPYVVTLRWRGADQPAPLALVGKGVCFDSGGLSIKPAGGMEEMKGDMAGAAAVVGAMLALAARRAKADVVGVIGLAENMPSGTAQRPGDVVRAMSGKTIEVINTDAEGRLVLADCLWYTKETFKPRAMVDLATLTGAVVTALGYERAGVLSMDDALTAQLIAAGEAVGERLWRLPMGKEYAKHVRSDIAEIKNVGRGRQAGATAGAEFLRHFVGDVPFAHLDIAGVAWQSKDLPLSSRGATGFGVRLLDRLVADAFEAPPA